MEFLLGHSIGLNSNYYTPTEQELLTDYLKAVPALTINDNNNIEKIEQQEQEVEKMKEELELLKKQQKSYEERNLKTLRNIEMYLAGKTDKILFEGKLPEL